MKDGIELEYIELVVEFVENARSELGQSQPHHSDLDDTLMEDLLVSMKSMQKS